VIAVHVEPNEHSELLQDDWEQYVKKPFEAAGKEPPQLHVLPSPYRFVIVPFVQFVLDLSKNILIAALSLLYRSWWRTNGTNIFSTISAADCWSGVLLARGNERIFTVSAPWYVGKRL